MKKLIWIFSTLILVTSSITSCQKPEEPTFQLLIIELSEEDKSLLNYYYDNPTITYSDQDGQELVFKADTLYYSLLGTLVSKYSCITGDVPNYSFHINLSRSIDSTLRLSISLDVDNTWSSHNISRYYLFPKSYSSVDTTYENGSTLKYDYYDSLTLRTEQFYNIFHLPNQDQSLSIDCFYANGFGIVAFDTEYGERWIRKKQ